MVRVETFFGWLEASMRLRGVRRHRWQDGDLELSYHAYGRPDALRTIVLVHGLGTSTLSWMKVFGALGKKHRVLAVDLPGWGHSPFPKGKDHATIPDLVAAVTRFLEQVPGRKVVLVGQSMGGWVSAKVAAQRPDLVQELILSNTAGVLYPEVGRLREKLDVQTHKAVTEFWGDMWHRVPFFYKFFTGDYVAKMHEPRVLRFFDTLTEADFINQDLERLQMPISILWGTSDRFIPITTVDIMIKHLGSANIHWIPNCGHIPALEQPKEFVRIVEGILRSPMATSAGPSSMALPAPSP
jgi:pimeloyl-ACP methyl ester carboxylesterase